LSNSLPIFLLLNQEFNSYDLIEFGGLQGRPRNGCDDRDWVEPLAAALVYYSDLLD
jgi:hypothetical protein